LPRTVCVGVRLSPFPQPTNASGISEMRRVSVLFMILPTKIVMFYVH
jgi:hypothetical protein